MIVTGELRSASPVRLALGGMFAMAVAMGIGRFVYTPILPSMMEGLGLSASDAGLIASANYLGYFVGAILASGGWGASRERVIVLAGLAASSLLAGAMALGDGVHLFAAIRFLAGMASALTMIFITTIVLASIAEAGRQDLQALHFSGVGLGIAVSSVLTGYLYAIDTLWHESWLWVGALSLVGAAIASLLIEKGPARKVSEKAEPALPRSASLYRVIVAYGIFGFGYVVTATFLVAIVRGGNSGPLAESAVWLVTGIAAFLSLWIWTPVRRRFGMAKSFALGCVVESAGVAASVVVPGIAGPLIGGALLGGTFVILTAFGLEAGRRRAGAAPRRVLAWMTAAFGIGQIIGPVVAGYMADWSGDFVLASLAAAVSLGIAAIIIPADRAAA